MTTLNSEAHKPPKGIIHNFTSSEVPKRMCVKEPYSFIKIFIFQFFTCSFENKVEYLEPKINQLIDFIESHGYLLANRILNSNSAQQMINFIEVLSEASSKEIDEILGENNEMWEHLSEFIYNLLHLKYNMREEEIYSIQSIYKLSEIFNFVIIQNENYTHFIDSKVFLYSHQANNYVVYSSTYSSNPRIQHEIIDLIWSDRSISYNLETNFENSLINIDFDDLTANALTNNNSVTIKIATEKKRISKFNINEELPNKFVLDNLVTEPYRTKINNIKTQANQMYLKI